MRIYGPFYGIISKVHVSSSCAVHSHIVFLESSGIFVLSQNLSLPKDSSNLIGRVIDLLRFSYFTIYFRGKSITIPF